MMDNILHIVPYTAEHGRFILSCQMNHALMDKDARFPIENFINEKVRLEKQAKKGEKIGEYAKSYLNLKK